MKVLLISKVNVISILKYFWDVLVMTSSVIFYDIILSFSFRTHYFDLKNDIREMSVLNVDLEFSQNDTSLKITCYLFLFSETVRYTKRIINIRLWWLNINFSSIELPYQSCIIK